MKKLFAVLLAVVMVLGLCACSVSEKPAETTAAPAATEAVTEAATEAAATTTEISLWTYPVGKWGEEAVVNELLKGFNEKYPNITVKVEYLAYADGDDKVNTAIEGNKAPDLVLEGPERLVANWGAKGKMVDLSDLWTADVIADTVPSVTAACKAANGAYYEYPLCMTAHCMAVNMTKVKEVGADKYIDTDKHTWSTEGFLNTVDALYNAGYENVAAIYCSGQGGDQGTRAIINNMYGGTFTDAASTLPTLPRTSRLSRLCTMPRVSTSTPPSTAARRSPCSATAPCRWLSAGTLHSRPTATTMMPA